MRCPTVLSVRCVGSSTAPTARAARSRCPIRSPSRMPARKDRHDGPGGATATGSPSAEGDHRLTHEISDPSPASPRARRAAAGTGVERHLELLGLRPRCLCCSSSWLRYGSQRRVEGGGVGPGPGRLTRARRPPPARSIRHSQIVLRSSMPSGTVTRRRSVYTVRVRRPTAWPRIAAAMPPSMAGRAGSHRSPSAGSSANRSPGSAAARCSSQGTHESTSRCWSRRKAMRTTFRSPGQASRQRHFASAEVTGRQLRER